MAFRIVRSVKRKGSSNHYFKERIPASVGSRAVGLTLLVPVGGELVPCAITPKTTTIRLSLRTPDPHEGKVRQAEVAAFFQNVWHSLKTLKPIALTRSQCIALAGEVYRSWTSERRGYDLEIHFERAERGSPFTFEEDPFVPAGGWEAALSRLPDPEGVVDPLEELEPLYGTHVDRLVREKGLPGVDTPSRRLILLEVLRAHRDGYRVEMRRASGDYSPAPEQSRFPAWEPPASAKRIESAPAQATDAVSLKGLVPKWWAEAKQANRSQSTHDSYKASVQKFAAFLKHDDARAVSHEDVIAFKNHRLESGISLATVKDNDLSGLKVVLGWAVSNRLLPANPALGVKVIKPKRIQTREKGFTPDEAKAILTRSLQHQPAANEKPQMTAAKRWVPWLCAYTGARVGEIVQLRKEDIRFHKGVGGGEGVYTITITPEAGTVKDKEVREVVLHPHLVEMGFPDFVKVSKAGPLFLAVRAGEDIRGKWRATKNRLAEFAREVVPDVRVKPNHGWRHLFQTRGHEAGIADSVLDGIGGWAPSSVARGYGDVTLQAQVAAFEKFPRFDIR